MVTPARDGAEGDDGLAAHDFLFIDVDGTITDPVGEPPEDLLGQSLLHLMREAAVEERGLGRDEAERIIRATFEANRWWHWSDFLCALGLDAHRFWARALEVESGHLGPVSDDLPAVFDRLLAAGFRMFVTSNNPSSGILLKLSIAGLADIWGSRYFLQYLNPPALHHMKEDPAFWRQALAHTGLDPGRITVIGDSWSDDVLAPRAAGIGSSIRIDPTRTGPPEREGGVWSVANWGQIEDLLLPAVRA